MRKIPLIDLDWRYTRYMLPFTPHIAFILLTLTAVAAFEIVMPWPLKYIVDNVLGGRPFDDPMSRAIVGQLGNEPRVLTAVFGLSMVAMAILSGLLSFTGEYLQGVVQARNTFRLRSDAYSHLQALSLQFHDASRTGEIINRVNLDVGRVMEALVAGTCEFTFNLLKFAGIAGVMWFVNWRFSLIVLAYAPLLLVVITTFRRNIHAATKASRREEGYMVSATQEIVSAIRIVQAFGREDEEQRRFDHMGTARLQAEIRMARWQALFEPLVDVIKALGSTAVIWFGVTEILAGQLSVGSLLIFLSYLTTLYTPLKKFGKLSELLQKAAVSGERLSDLLDNDLVVRDLPDALGLKRARGHIEFHGVSFAYEQRSRVLEHISFEVKHGQTVALVGTTGAGKTTIVNLLMRFYEMSDGWISLDGVDIRRYRLRDLRRQFALVPQEPILFATSIRDNIAYGRPEASVDEIIAAARAANVHDFVAALPGGYDTIIGERGALLSGGQRQRIAIARAILYDAPMLILDEPTSALDAAVERDVMEALERLMQGRTTLIIAHHLSTIRHADHIVILEEGRVVDRGAHDDLMRDNCHYARLVRLQSTGPRLLASKSELGLKSVIDDTRSWNKAKESQQMSRFSRFIRWTIVLLPALLAPAISLYILLTGLQQTAAISPIQTVAPLSQASAQPRSMPAADMRASAEATQSEGQPATSMPSSIAATMDQSDLPESSVPPVGSIPVLFDLVTTTKVIAPTATPMPTRRPFNTAATAATPHPPAHVSRATNTVEPANPKEAVQNPEPPRPLEPVKTSEPDDKGKGREFDDRGKPNDDK